MSKAGAAQYYPRSRRLTTKAIIFLNTQAHNNKQPFYRYCLQLLGIKTDTRYISHKIGHSVITFANLRDTYFVDCVPRYGRFLWSQWCLDVGGSGRRWAGLCCLTCDGGRVCATATHCLISCVWTVFLFYFFSCRQWRRAVHVSLGGCQSWAISPVANHGPATFSSTASAAGPSLHYHP